VLVVDVQIEAHAEVFNTAAARADLRLLALCAILGLTGWTGLARLLRAETLKLRELDYIQAARAFGVSHARILARHVLPNVMHLVIITVVLDFSGLVLAEAVLSYVGAGVDPDPKLWQHDQRCPSGAGTRAGGVVAAGHGLHLSVRPGAGRQPVC